MQKSIKVIFSGVVIPLTCSFVDAQDPHILRVSQRQPTPLIPVQLRCEYAENPLGIDISEPRFSWILQSSQRDTLLSALLNSAPYHVASPL